MLRGIRGVANLIMNKQHSLTVFGNITMCQSVNMH